MNKEIGQPYPLGATIINNGVNFSVFAPEADKIELLLFKHINDIDPITIELDKKTHKSYYYWHIYIKGIEKNQLYGYRVYGDFNPNLGKWFDGTKVLVDPYAKIIVGEYDRHTASQFGIDNIHSCLKSAVISNDFDWEDDVFPDYSISNSLIYELHLAGFTENANSDIPKNLRGTISGLVKKIPYLKSLGITAVELLPVYAYDKQDAPFSNINYWGYSPINFFAVHSEYSSKSTPQDIIDEFKSMVKIFHSHGIEVLLDVVYNHTTENDGYNGGPTISFRGFSNNSYYLMDNHGNFKNYSGTGNTLNANHSVVRRMIMDSLKYWRKEMHIDGFRFDLASILSRDEQGDPLTNPPILWSIDSDPELSKTKIIAEPWDATGLYQVYDFAGDRWCIWNDDFRDTVRKFVKGDCGQVYNFTARFLGSQNEMNARHVDFKPHQNIHFISCHDGFTMFDLVSFNEKHNHENGENNQDGSNQNHSWNCGMEGYSDNEYLVSFRLQQVKNFLTILLLSHGTPMINMGDEIIRKQFGNNNVYCQNNPMAWMNWDISENESNILSYFKELIHFKKRFKLFSNPEFFLKVKDDNSPYVLFHGILLNQPDWNYHSHSIAMELVHPKFNESLYLIFNMYHEELIFQIPKGKWRKALCTYQDEGTILEYSINCAARSITVLEKI